MVAKTKTTAPKGESRKAATCSAGRESHRYPADSHARLTANQGIPVTLRKVIEEAAATIKIVAPRVGGAKLVDGHRLAADGQLADTPSVIFDTVAVVLSAAAGKALAKDALAVGWMRDASGHLKAIAYDGGGKALLQAGGMVAGKRAIEAVDTSAFLKAALTRQWGREPKLRMLA